MILEPKKIKYVTLSTVSRNICHEVMGPDAMIFVFWMLSFKPTFHSPLSLSSRASSSSLSGIRVVSSVYIRLLVYLPVLFILAYASSSPAFCMMYSAYKLNKMGDNIQPWHIAFQIWNQSLVPCLFLTVASWPAYRFLRRQVRWSGIPISLRIFQFVVINKVKDFNIISEREVDVFLELSCFFYELTDIGNFISGSSAFSKSSLDILKFSVHVLMLVWRILSITLLAYEMNAIVW